MPNNRQDAGAVAIFLCLSKDPTMFRGTDRYIGEKGSARKSCNRHSPDQIKKFCAEFLTYRSYLVDRAVIVTSVNSTRRNRLLFQPV